MAPVLGLLAVIMGLVLVLPFSVKWVEEELELFLLFMGSLAVTVSGLWDKHLIREAVEEPVKISLAVLLFGHLFRSARDHIRRGVSGLARRMGMGPFLFTLVAGLGLLSSAMTAIIASLVLVEAVTGLKLSKESETRITVFACFSIGLGAALTPLGEPLSTIAISKLAGPPHHAGFFYLARLLGIWIVPGILIMGLLAAMQAGGRVAASQSLSEDSPENLEDVAVRAGKVYIFVAALVLLARGLTPIVDRYILGTPKEILYWLNSVSAILDNATLAAAEISPQMRPEDVQFLLLGLLIAGGMLIPGNIPNIICAGKLGIKSGAWARVGLPLGLGLMAACFALLKLTQGGP